MHSNVVVCLFTFLMFGAAGRPLPLTHSSAARSDRETVTASAVDSRGFLYLAGNNVDGSAFVAQVSPDGAERLYTARLSGRRTVRAIAIDSMGFAWIAGSVGSDAFVARLNAKGTAWLLNRKLGGSALEQATAIAIDALGNAVVAGWTDSRDFPLVDPRQTQMSGRRDAFVVKLNAAGETVFATYVGGGSSTEASGVGVDAEGNIYVAGTIRGRGTPGLLSGTRDEGSAFLVRLSDDSSRAELLGDGATALAVEPDGSATLAGRSGDGGFIARFGSQGERLFVKSLDTPVASLGIDPAGNSYLLGGSYFRKLSRDGTQILVEGAVEEGPTIAVDFRGRAYIGTSSTSTCDFRLSRAAATVAAEGGTVEINVDTTPECMWTPATHSDWIQPGQGSSGKNTLRIAIAPNTGAPRAATVAIAGQTLVVAQMGSGREAITGPIRANAGFQANALAACDDSCSSAAFALGFSINFYGTTYSSVYVNNNGNITFGNSTGSYTPTTFAGLGTPMIAPFWADVDTRGTGSGLTRYGTDLVNGRKAFGANWIDVGYYSNKIDKLNSFQVVLIDRGDLGVGFFDIEMNYGTILWETGSASGGTNGFGGYSARAGFTNGTGNTGTNFELPGSGVNGALLNSGGNSLINNTNAGVLGRYVYGVRAGNIVCATGINPTSASVPIAGAQLTIDVTASNAACTWNVAGLPSWAHLTQPANGTGTGSGQVRITVDANAGAVRNSVITVAGQNYGINQAGSTSIGTPLRFVPVTPCRVADTRNANGPFGGPAITGGTARDFVIPSSACSIPTNAAAYSLNVTVVPIGALSYLTIWPTGQSQPLVSTLNSFDGRVKANAAIVPAGTSGAISVFVTNTANVVLDINGYFVPASGDSNLAFYPVTPCRVADTRNANGSFGGPIINAGQSRSFPVRQSPCGIPANAQAYSLNMTAVPTGGLGYITTWPTGTNQPFVSTLNAPTGTVVANAAIVPSGTNGDVSVYASNTTHIVIDINGYFAPPGTGGLAFYAATPCRVADTRNPTGPFGGPSIATNNSRSFTVSQSGCNVPTAATAFSVNATVVPPAALAYLSLFPGGGAVPFVSTLNAFDAAITSNAAIVPAGATGGLGAFASNTTDVIIDINGYFAP